MLPCQINSAVAIFITISVVKYFASLNEGGFSCGEVLFPEPPEINRQHDRFVVNKERRRYFGEEILRHLSTTLGEIDADVDVLIREM